MQPDRPAHRMRREIKQVYEGQSRMRSKLLLAVATPLFALLAHGQQAPSSVPDSPDDGLTPQSQSLNCSDPTLASSPQCQRGQSLGAAANPSLLGNSTNAESLSSQPGHVTTFNDESRRLNTSNQRPPQPLPPEPLTEFQKFIISTTGQVLPVYGANLFRNVPSTFAPLENTPVPSDYILGPDDEVRIRVWGQVNFNANLHVDRTGEIFLPQIGAVHVAGLRFDELQQHLREAISRVYRNFQMTAELGQIRSVQVYITGEARRPGAYTVSSLATLLDALFASGGPSVQGSMRSIELRRGGKTVTTLDLYRLLVEGDKTKDTGLLPGDLIFIPPVGQEVALLGSVHRPAIYEIVPGDTVSSVLRSAGGTTALASEARASLERTVDHSGRQAMEVRLDAAGLATAVKDGDVLQILPLVTKFQRAVTLRGNTANPGRFAWHEGMRLSNLIPDRESLLTRDYWWRRAQAGVVAPEFQPLRELYELRQPNSPIDLLHPVPSQSQENPPNGQTSQNQTPSSEDPYHEFDTTPLVPAYPQDRSPQSEEANRAAATQYNASTRGSQSALAEPADDTAESLNPPRTHRTVIRLNVAEIDWSYAVIERVDPTTLKSQLVQFDLGKLVNDHDSSQDLALQPGDVVTVFSQSDIHVPVSEQTTFVRLEGEFLHSGTYSAQPGETLRSLVARAGGLSQDAYLYGSVFTRESTRILQQRRIDESVRQMSMEMQRGNLALAANPVSSSGDIAGANAAQVAERELIAQLQQIRATGRVVFQFRADSAGLDTIPNIKLENGDTFLIPSLPSTVNVLGAVYNQNSFVYRPGGEVLSFLNLAGGANSSADRGREFVIRANGDVLSRTVVKSVWGNEFYHLKLYPGDTIIVPEKIIKSSALRGILDWTQIFSQLAFGAAAINVLK
jgi:protein involved in polysaccharide export with SLBB domain